MNARWALVLATLIAGVLLIVGVGRGFALRAGGDTGGAPLQLSGLPPAALAQNGLVLRTAAAPPYCGLVAALSDRWLTVGVAGCPIAERWAYGAAEQGSRSAIQASALAWASQPANPSIGRGRLVWAIALQNGPPAGVPVCPPAGLEGSTPPCLGERGMRLVLVDAVTGRVLSLATPGASGAGVWQPHT